MSQETPSNQESSTLADALAAVSQGDLSHRVLIRFADLDRFSLRVFEREFPAIEEEYRARFIQALDDLIDLSFEYNFDRILLVALNDESAVVRQRAIASLWTNSDTSLIHPLSTMLEDESIDVRAEAASALGRFAFLCELEELPESTGDALFARLYAIASDPRAPILVARRAIESLGNFGSRPEVRELIREAHENDDQSIRAAALFAMGRTMDDRWFDLLVDELNSDDSELRFEAARSLGLIGDTRAVEGLARLATDEDSEVRLAAIDAIGEIGSPGSERVLRRLAERSTDEDEIAAIMDALEELEARDSTRWGDDF